MTAPKTRWPQSLRVLAISVLPAVALAAEVDTDTGLVRAPGWEEVRTHCGGCHSHSIVTNQRANRDAWRDMIRWMQRTQNLWVLPPKSEAEILDYLAANYSPDTTRQRRAPIPPALMPPPATTGPEAAPAGG